MAVLSKMVIEQIAGKMTEKSKKYAEQMDREWKELATTIYESQLPVEVMKLFKSHSEYVQTVRDLYIDGHGLNREYVELSKQLPSPTKYNNTIKLTAAIGEKLVNAKRKKEKAFDDYKQLLREIESALYALKTDKNVRENLPEAIPYLPPPMSNALVVNFDALQKKLNKQPEVVKAVVQ
jgi:hypothetical protein